MDWSIEDSKKIYGIEQDDLHFLSISEQGKMVLSIDNLSITMEELIERVGKRFPNRSRVPSFTLRMPQLINSQIGKLLSNFDQAIDEYGYRGNFKPLYPIKVNQLKREVTTVMNSSQRYGLEAGTKSELFLILKVFRQHKSRIIMCNGVKDIDYIRIVKKAILDGYNIYISIESITELRHVIEHLPHSKTNLFLRIKPYVSMHGYWGSSAGRNSKFGLNISDLRTVVKMLKESGLIDRLLGIHAHPGSQVGNSYELAQYFKFMVDTFIDLRDSGCHALNTINFGGGLPIDYDGRLPGDNQEKYTKSMVGTIVRKLEETSYDHPDIMVEAGRAITALSSMLVIQPLEYHPIFPKFDPDEYSDLIEKHPELELVDSIDDIVSVWTRWSKLPDNATLEELEDYEKEIGLVKYHLRKLFFSKAFTLDHLKNSAIKELISADSFLLGNFSVFNGVCDFVLIGQYFPVLPIQDLHVQPETVIRLVDITCDSDGEISIYRTKQEEKQLFTKDGYPLTSLDPLQWNGFPIGKVENVMKQHMLIPLVGAYQDIIQFDHNLIGDLPDVEMKVSKEGIKLEVVNQATNVQDLLKDVGYNLKNKENPYISTEEV